MYLIAYVCEKFIEIWQKWIHMIISIQIYNLNWISFCKRIKFILKTKTVWNHSIGDHQLQIIDVSKLFRITVLPLCFMWAIHWTANLCGTVFFLFSLLSVCAINQKLARHWKWGWRVSKCRIFFFSVHSEMVVVFLGSFPMP